MERIDLTFEHAMVRAALYGEPSRIDWHCDPGRLFEELEQGRIPESAIPVEFSMEIR